MSPIFPVWIIPVTSIPILGYGGGQMKNLILIILLAVSSLFQVIISACQTSSQTEQESVVVIPGKNDDYYSYLSREYYIEGKVVLNKDDVTTNSVFGECFELQDPTDYYCQWGVGAEFDFVAYSLNNQKNTWATTADQYFNVMNFNLTFEDLRIEFSNEGQSLSFFYSNRVVAPPNLFDRIDTYFDDQGRRWFELEYMADDTNVFLSGKEPEIPRTVNLLIRKLPQSRNAWIDYNRLLEDNELTIAIHIGYFEEIYDTLNILGIKYGPVLCDYINDYPGIKTPVSDCNNFTNDSGPIEKTFIYDGRTITMKLWIYWGEEGTSADPNTDEGSDLLNQQIGDSLLTKDVFIYGGHSGPGAGFSMSSKSSFTIQDIIDAEMPDNRYQIVMINGCNTSSLAETFFQNRYKQNRQMINIITTGNLSIPLIIPEVTDLAWALVPKKSSELNELYTVKELIRNIERNLPIFNTGFGIYGIDNNPKLHPLAKPEQFCKDCRHDSNCGPGHVCAKLDGTKSCFGLCTDNEGCPDGYRCMEIAIGWFREAQACIPTNHSCQTPPPEEQAPLVIINEVLPGPQLDFEIDANGDGTVDRYEDEFVEIYNADDETIYIGGWSLADGTAKRFFFDLDLYLAPGEAVIVFGGGERPYLPGAVHVYSTDWETTLGLNDNSDVVSLYDFSGLLIDRFQYGGNENPGVSYVRKIDGDPKSEFVLHPELPASPGLRQNGEPF
jgi:hypothetical protein